LRPAARVAGLLACAAAVSTAVGCHRKHVPVEAVPEVAYPACGDAGTDDRGTVVASERLRSGPLSNEQNVVEQFELDRTACGYAYHARQEWPLDISDVEIRYDASLTPIWAWKRMTTAASRRPDGNADIRRYDLRTADVFIKRRDADGRATMEKLLPGGRMTAPQGARVGAVIAPGRGSITAWLKRTKLPVGGKTEELVLDMRPMIESLEVGTLQREPDQFEPDYGKNVRVYTFFGRETVFADDSDVVIGDLAGMRTADLVKTPEPEPLPTYGGADPVHTP
jgi:hypothetical protein